MPDNKINDQQPDDGELVNALEKHIDWWDNGDRFPETINAIRNESRHLIAKHKTKVRG